MVSSRPVMPIAHGIVFVGAFAMHAQAFDARRKRIVVGKDGAAVAIAAERLGRGKKLVAAAVVSEPSLRPS